MHVVLTSPRLVIRSWCVRDAGAAIETYGAPEVAHWLAPAMARVTDLESMRLILRAWEAEQYDLAAPQGRWAIHHRAIGSAIGGLTIRPLSPYDQDLEVSWQLAPRTWGNGYATEAASTLLTWAFTQDVEELIALARPNNARAIATAKRLGMRLVGETVNYYGLRMQLYRIRQNGFPRARFTESVQLGRMG
jgi:RimJ/RimL family protein N-acetyltransferase